MRDQHFDLQPGRTLGPNYHIVEFLGGGWEGEVYKVEERRTGIIRAAKLFYHRQGVREAPLLRYARKLYKLRSCPIIIQYHHRGIARVKGDQIEYLVSDLADGVMLSNYLEAHRKKRLPIFEAMHLLYAVTLGVEQVHYLGEYHGDIHSDNIMVKKKGMGFDVRLIDFFDLGAATKEKIQYDVYDLIALLYEMIGGYEVYGHCGPEVRQIVMGRKHGLIRKKFQNAGHLRLALENLEWSY